MKFMFRVLERMDENGEREREREREVCEEKFEMEKISRKKYP